MAKKKDEPSPIVHIATAILAFFAGYINACGLGLFAKTIGNVTGLVTNLGVDLVTGTSELFLVLQFCCFLLGSTLSGILISSRRAGIGTELYGIVLMLVSGLIFAGWATAIPGYTGHDSMAPCILAGAMGLQNGMLTKHAHAVVRTTHMTGTLTDIGVLIGHQIGRSLQRLSRWQKGARESEEQRRQTLADIAKEWTQLKLLTLLLVAFFTGSVCGMGMFRAVASDALLLPAAGEAVMGVGYLVFRTVLRPMWKRRVRSSAVDVNAEARAEAQADTPAGAAEAARSLEEGFDGVGKIDAKDELRPLTPKAGRRWQREDDGAGSYATTMSGFEVEEGSRQAGWPRRHSIG